MVDRKRSPNYPSISLEEAIAGIKQFYASERRTAVDGITASKAIGYNSMSGAARVKLGSLKQYGLLSGRGEKLAISDLGLRIVLPANDGDAEAAVREAALSPNIFMKLYETHAEASTNATVSYLVREMGFAEDSARRLDRAFRETLKFAKIQAETYNTGVESPVSATQETPTMTSAAPLSTASAMRGSNALVLSVPYVGGALSVQVSVAPGERLTQKLVEKVVKFLTLAKEDLPADGDTDRQDVEQ